MLTYFKLEGLIELPCEEPKPKGKYLTIKKIGGEKANIIYNLCEVEVYSANLKPMNEGLFRFDCLTIDEVFNQH